MRAGQPTDGYRSIAPRYTEENPAPAIEYSGFTKSPSEMLNELITRRDRVLEERVNRGDYSKFVNLRHIGLSFPRSTSNNPAHLDEISHNVHHLYKSDPSLFSSNCGGTPVHKLIDFYSQVVERSNNQ